LYGSKSQESYTNMLAFSWNQGLTTRHSDMMDVSHPQQQSSNDFMSALLITSFNATLGQNRKCDIVVQKINK